MEVDDSGLHADMASVLPILWRLDSVLCGIAEMEIRKNQSICEWQGVEPSTPDKNSIIELAIESLDNGLIYGLRQKFGKGTNGWYIWSGEYSDTQDFFKPVCVEHLNNYINIDLTEYLDLPPDFRFLIDGSNYEDVWFDNTLIE